MLPLIALFACTGSPQGHDSDDSADSGDSAADTGPAVLSLKFHMDSDYIPVMADDGQAPVGPFLGSIFAEDQSTDVGPIENAVSLVDFSVDIDLTPNGGPTDVVWTSEPMDPQILWVLGCLDADGNDCEQGDPITLPPENKLRLEAGGTTFTIQMGMLRP